MSGTRILGLRIHPIVGIAPPRPSPCRAGGFTRELGDVRRKNLGISRFSRPVFVQFDLGDVWGCFVVEDRSSASSPSNAIDLGAHHVPNIVATCEIT
jgi:hypothetical protein